MSPLDDWFDLDEDNSDGCPNTIIFINVFGGIVVVGIIATILFRFYRKLRKLQKETGTECRLLLLMLLMLLSL